MKIRKGFVSNSSSTSFCIYGVCFEDVDDVIELHKKLFNRELTDDELDEVYELADEIAGKLELECHSPGDDYYYFGRSWSDIKDDETGKQFKENIEKKLGLNCATHEESWYS